MAQSIQQFASMWQALESGGLIGQLLREVERPAKIIAVSGAKESMNAGVSPDGTPYRPLANPRPGGGGSDKPLRDRGLLMGSLRAEVAGRKLDLSASHPASQLMHYGGRVEAHKQWLTIPVTREAKRVGSPGVNHFPRPLFFVKSRKPNTALLAERKGKGKGKGKLIVQYVLKKSVVVPPRPFVGFSEKTKAQIDALVADKAADLIAKNIGGGGK